MHKNLTIVLLSITLTACAGGTIGGLFPAPKILDGKLDGLKYTSPDQELRVIAPVSEERAEWTYTQVKEHSEQHQDQNSRFVGFKTPYDSHFYSVEVVNYLSDKKLTQDLFEVVKKDTLTRIIGSTEDRWSSKVVKLNETEISCENNSNYTNSVFKQHITSHKPNFDKYYLISLSYNGNSVAIVTSELNFNLGQKNIPVNTIKKVNYQKHQQFVCSVGFGD